jgi:hypothetical protein
LGVIFALLTEGMDAAHREEMWEQLSQPMRAEQINRRLQQWQREVFGGA